MVSTLVQNKCWNNAFFLGSEWTLKTARVCRMYEARSMVQENQNSICSCSCKMSMKDFRISNSSPVNRRMQEQNIFWINYDVLYTKKKAHHMCLWLPWRYESDDMTNRVLGLTKYLANSCPIHIDFKLNYYVQHRNSIITNYVSKDTIL